MGRYEQPNQEGIETVAPAVQLAAWSRRYEQPDQEGIETDRELEEPQRPVATSSPIKRA